MKTSYIENAQPRVKNLLVSSILPFLVAVASPAQAGPLNWSIDWLNDFTVSHDLDWQTIRAIDVSGGAHAHVCQVVASLDAENPGGADNNQFYYFTLTVNNANPPLNASGSERTIEMGNQPDVLDPSFMPVSTNRAFTMAANTNYTVRLLGRKAVGVPDITVDDYYISVQCT